jgi:hypothetical protein
MSGVLFRGGGSGAPGRWGQEEAGGAWTGGSVLSAFVFSYWVPVSWVAREARELVYASMGCETGGDGTDGINGRDQGQCGGVCVRRGSVGAVATENIATGGGGAFAGDPGGMMEKATALASRRRSRSTRRCPLMTLVTAGEARLVGVAEDPPEETSSTKKARALAIRLSGCFGVSGDGAVFLRRSWPWTAGWPIRLAVS